MAEFVLKVQDIDDRGKISLKPVGEEWQVPEGAESEASQERPPRRDRDRRPRDRERRPRDRDRDRNRDRGSNDTNAAPSDTV